MEDKKIRYNGEEISTSIIPIQIPTDTINPWKNEVWLVKSGRDEVLYYKNKTWQNCWLKYGLIQQPEEENRRVASNIDYLFINVKENTTRPYLQFRFPPINNLQDYIERGGYLGHLGKQMVDSNWFKEELYRVVPLVNWAKYPETYKHHKFWNFLGNLFFTHAWDSKGVSLGERGWRDPWVFNFREKPQGSESWQGYCLSFFLSGSNISNIELRFGSNVLIANAQGMFKALQVPLNLKISDLEGRPIDSTLERGFTPYIITNIFKQTGEQIRKTPININYHNVHSCGELVGDTWGLVEFSSYKDVAIGTNTPENTLQPGRPDNNYINSNKTYPNFGRENYAIFANAYGLEKIGPLLDFKFLDKTDSFNNSANIKQMRLKNLNFGDWNFSHLTKLDEPSVKYLLNNVWDRQRGFDELAKVEGQSEEVIRRVKNTYLVQDQIRKTITCPSQWDGFITQEMIDLVIDRGWNLVVGGVTKQRSESVVPKVMRNVTITSNGTGLLKYSINGQEFTSPQVHSFEEGTLLNIVATPKPNETPETGISGKSYNIVSVGGDNGDRKTIDNLSGDISVEIVSNETRLRKFTFTVYNADTQIGTESGYIDIETV